MSLQPKLLGSTSFAHLVGLARPAGSVPVPPLAPRAESAEEDDSEEMKKAEEEARKAEEDAKRAEDDAKKAREKANKAKKKAKGAKRRDDLDPDNDDDDDEDEEGDDDDDREEASAASPAYAARLRERARCAAIFADPAAAHNPGLAAQLAFGTSLPRSEAIGVLRAGGVAAPAGRRGLSDRMSAAAIPAVGPDVPQQNKKGPEAIAASIIASYEQARGLVGSK